MRRPFLCLKTDPIWDIFVLRGKRLEHHGTIKAPNKWFAVQAARYRDASLDGLSVQAFRKQPTKTTANQRAYQERKATKSARPTQ